MLEFFGLLFSGGVLLKNEFVDMSVNEERRTNAYKRGDLYYTNTGGKTKLVETNEPVHREIYRGSDVLCRDKDGTIVYNYTEAQKQKAAKHDFELNEKNKQEAIATDNDLYIYRIPREYKDKYNIDREISYFLKSIKTGEVFGSRRWDGRHPMRTMIYPISIIEAQPEKKGFITISTKDGSSFKSVVKPDGTVHYERVNEIKSIVI